MRRILALVIAGLACCTGVSCSANYPTSPGTTPPLAGLQIQYPSPTPDPRVGRTISLVAYAVDADGGWTDVTTQAAWHTTDSSVLRTAAGSGTVLAVGEGSAYVVASYGGVTASLPVTVRPESPPYPQLDFTNLTSNPSLRSGGATLTRRLSPTAAATFVTGLAAWTSSNPEVATVTVVNSASAAFIPVSTGNTRIVATLDGQSVSLGFSVAPRQ